MLRLRVTIAVALFAVAADRPVSADEIGNRFPGIEWDRTDPAAVGWSSDTPSRSVVKNDWFDRGDGHSSRRGCENSRGSRGAFSVVQAV